MNTGNTPANKDDRKKAPLAKKKTVAIKEKLPSDAKVRMLGGVPPVPDPKRKGE